jgi:hypothetical protein
MANTLPSMTLLADLSLPALKTKAPFINAFATNLSSNYAVKGTGITVPYVTPTSASLWAGTFAPSDNTVTGVTITMPEPYYRSVGFSPNELASYDEQTLANTFIQPMINDVLNEVMKQIYTILSPTNFPICVYSSSLANYSTASFKVVQLGAKVLDKSGSMADPVALLNVDADYALQEELKDTFGASATILNGATSYKAGRTTVYPAYGLPSGGGVGGVVTTPDAVAILTRLPEPLGSGVEQTAITDPDTGLSVALERWSDPTLGKVIYAVKLMAGVVKGRPGFGAQIKFTD